jgi:uncharacterized membrane protein
MEPINIGSDKPSRESHLRSRYLLLAQALLALALAGAAYLAWGAISNGPLAGCGSGSGCDKVLHSRWAYWLGLPVSLPAVLAYAGLIGLTFLARKPQTPDNERGLWAVIVVVSIVVVTAALWFIALQMIVIHAFCPFCMGVHSCGLLASVFCLKSIPFATDPTTPMWTSGSGKRGVPWGAALILVLIGLVGASALVGGQLLVQKQRNLVVTPPQAGGPSKKPVTVAANPGTSAAAPSTGAPIEQPASPNARLAAPRLLSLYDNRFNLRLDYVPILGSPDAPHVAVYLYDYSCPHCRELHAILATAQRQFSNDLAVVLLPMPMSTNCNPVIPSSFFSSSNSCEFARLGLALWLANPEAQHRFDAWFFAPDKSPTLEQAREYAAQLVGTEKLQSTLADPWVQEQINTDCLIYHANWQASGRPAMPQLILGEAVSIGPLNSVEHLLVLLNRYLRMDVGLNRR